MKFLKLIVILAFPLILGGCAYMVAAGAGAGAGVATYAYIKGVLKVEYPYDYDTVWNATVGALRDMKIAIEEKSRDSMSGTIKARRYTGTKVKIKVERKAARITYVKIRVGTFGNKEYSIAIKEAIDRRLGVR